MRTVIASLLVVLTLGAAHADEDEDIRNGDVLVPASMVRQVVDPRHLDGLRGRLLLEEASAKQLRNGGIVTTVVGSLMTFIGVGLFMKGFCDENCHGDEVAGTAGIALLTLGQIGVVTGIPIWATGQAKVSRAEERRLSVNSTGLTLQF